MFDILPGASLPSDRSQGTIVGVMEGVHVRREVGVEALLLESVKLSIGGVAMNVYLLKIGAHLLNLVAHVRRLLLVLIQLLVDVGVLTLRGL